MNKTMLAMLITIGMFTSINQPLFAETQTTLNSLQQIINGKHRSADNKHRDQYRHPEQTLSFFDIKEDMTVVEVWPGQGWYTEILAPFLKEKGKLYAAHFSPMNQEPYFQETLQVFNNKLHKNPDLYDHVEVTVLQPPVNLQIAPEETADRILTFRNIHNWMSNDSAAMVFNAMFKALKPGGILGVVEHRGAHIIPQDPKAKSGYVNEDYVIDLARNAGFEFLAKSEINANPKDTKNYPVGVWTLPPTLKLREQDKQNYLAIGESDRMTLKFVKPQKNAITSFLPKSLFASTDREELTQIPKVIHNLK